jgi:hypothetical protein
MSIHATLPNPDPPRSHAAPDAVTLCFDGRFRFGIDQWSYVPFEVPRGVRRITVHTSHDRFSLGVARNVLDLGIFGPAGYDLGNAEGFRGWSGGARDGFTVSATDATPGYLCGDLEAGRWALAFGPVVLNPTGMAWGAKVTLEFGPALPRPAFEPSAGCQAPTAGPGWYRGDLHLHTVHSDGRYRPSELVAVARETGLDFIASTDHNTNAANAEWSATGADGLVVIPGEEVTTRHGHWLAIGLPPGGWVDWRYAPRDQMFAGHAQSVRRTGGIVVAAHPAVPVPGSAWEFGYREVDAVEVWNGTWNLDDEVSLRIWQRLLRRGRRIAAVAGSDSHGPHQRVGSPHTVVHACALTTAELLDGLRRGRSYLAESTGVTVNVQAWAQVAGRTRQAGPGEILPTEPGSPVTVDATVHGAPDTDMTIVTATGRAARTRVDGSGTGRLRWTSEGGSPEFARVEVRRSHCGRIRSMVALTNPVWLS